MPKVSVIVPVYGVEKYIERCAKSLFEQTLDDIEFIFVDDCSQDNSISVLMSVVEKYPSRKEQVFITRHTVNKGLPFARRTGLKIAKGDYIIHCDSDDWVDREMYQMMYDKAVEDKSDIVVCDICTTDGSVSKNNICLYSTNKDDIFRDFLTTRIASSLCNKLIHRDLYKNEIVFPIWNMGEDAVVSFQLFYYSKSISYIPQPYYFYFRNTYSICSDLEISSVYQRFVQAISNADSIFKFISNHCFSQPLECEIEYFKLRQKGLLMPLLKMSEYRKIWIETYREINFHLFFNKFISLKEKISLLLFYLHIRNIY